MQILTFSESDFKPDFKPCTRFTIGASIAIAITIAALAIVILTLAFPHIAFIAAMITLVKTTLGLTLGSATIAAIGIIASGLLIKKALDTPFYVGAGVLPYCVENSIPYFLLSKERKGPCKDRWCDWGGSKDWREEPKVTAAREASEESKEMLGKKATLFTNISHPVTNNSRQFLYFTYFLKLNGQNNFDANAFLNKPVASIDDEKSNVAWVKVQDVYNAVIFSTNNQLGVTNMTINGKEEILREDFVKSVESFFSNFRNLLPAELQNIN